MLKEGLKPLDLLIEEEGNEVQFLNSKVMLFENRITTKWYCKPTMKLCEFGGIVSRKAKMNILIEQYRTMKMLTDCDSELKLLKIKLTKAAKEANYPENFVSRAFNQVDREDGEGERNLWNVNFKEIIGKIEET